MRPAALIAADQRDGEDGGLDPDADVAPGTPKCSHCHTHRTSVWRRSKTGAKLCNACGVYARLRGRDRPLSLRRNKIRPRCKHPKQQS
jgi:GATA-binding protein 2